MYTLCSSSEMFSLIKLLEYSGSLNDCSSSIFRRFSLSIFSRPSRIQAGNCFRLAASEK